MSWTSEWPTETGYYWFHGWCFRDRNYEARTYLVRVRHTSNSVAYITEGHFIYESQAEGVWMPADIPHPQGAL